MCKRMYVQGERVKDYINAKNSIHHDKHLPETTRGVYIHANRYLPIFVKLVI